RSSQQHERAPGFAEVNADGFVHVVENTYHTQHWRGVNPFSQGLVIEADIAAGDGNFQFFTCLGHAVHDLGKLPHDVRLFRVPKVQTIGGGDGGSARAGHVARRFSDGVHGAQAWIEIAPAPV